MDRVKTDPESKYGLEIVVMAVTEEFLISNQELLPGLSRQDKTTICQADDCDGLFRLYFLMEDFLALDDKYVVDIIMGVMEAIDEKTGDPDPHMDLQFSTLTSDENQIIEGIGLNEKLERISTMMGEE